MAIIPVIDLGGLDGDTAAAARLAEAVHKACTSNGEGI